MALSTNKKRAGVLGAAALLVAGVAGVGAVTTLTTALTGNHFSADVRAEDDDPVTGARVEVTGDPIVHTFDTTKYNDVAPGTWTITNHGTDGAPFDGTFAPTGEISASLAENLTVQYGDDIVAGQPTTWRDAGTLANPVSYADALSLKDATLAGGESRVVPVRVILSDPTALEGDAGETLTVGATFTVTYVDTAS
jgi:hypothetical protein